jgi:ribosome-associated heat shock protein Hsp15
MHTADSNTGVRLDKWLWAARFYKTRALAAEAVGGGKVEVNGRAVKRSRVLEVGDRVRIRLSERRGPAAEAATLYEETPASREARERVAAQIRAERQVYTPAKGRPTKKDRRDLARLKDDLIS